MIRTISWVAAIVGALAAGALGVERAPVPASQPAVSELPPILSPEARREAAQRMIDRFVEHVEGGSAFSPEARQVVTHAWAEHRGDEQIEEFLLTGLAILSEPLMSALNAMDKQDYAKADAALRPLLGASDAYLSLHAAALLGRSLVEQDKLDEAEPLLAALAAREQDLRERTFLEPEVDFLLAYCQLANLKYDDALSSLQCFEQEHPTAPERFRLPVRQMLQELEARQPESLGEVSDLMGYAGRRLGHGTAGQPVQTRQHRAVELLSKLIEEAEQREKNQSSCKDCQGQGCPKCKGSGGGGAAGGMPSQGAKLSQAPEGSGRVGDLHRAPPARPGDVWGEMRPQERARILQALDKNFPSQYRQLIEQYYKQLAKEQ
jgi:hypothetical protein